MKQPEKLQLNEILLFIDSSLRAPVVALFSEAKKIEQIELESDRVLSEELLVQLEKSLKRQGAATTDLRAIFVSPGPGSYTGLRVGITTANVLAFSLDIPILVATKENIEEKVTSFKINGNKFGCPVMPIYGQAPHITQKKHRH